MSALGPITASVLMVFFSGSRPPWFFSSTMDLRAGSRAQKTPAVVPLAPNPYVTSRALAAGRPRGISTKFGISTYVPNIAKPAMTALTFVSRIGRCASMRMSTSGSSTWVST